MKPVCIDLFCGLGGWAEGFLAEGYDVIGFDIERRPYPGQLVLQDVMTLHGSQFRDAAVIVASPPCQAYSYRAMPWKRAKALPPPSNELFDACFRIQREANEAAYQDGCVHCGIFHPATTLDGCEFQARYIPLVVENVCGAQKWVGRAAWHFGSFYLWGDVPALMPPIRGRKNHGGSWFAVAHNTTSGHSKNPVHELVGQKLPGNNAPRMWAERRIQRLADANRYDSDAFYLASSGSTARKQASAEIAKIPFDLANHIARVYRPDAAIPDSVCNGVEPLDSGVAFPNESLV